MALPQSFLQHLRQKGYHPRSNKHSDALGEAIVRDLVSTCDPIADRAATGELVYQLNFDVTYGTSTANVDVVLGQPPPGSPPPEGDLIDPAPAIRRSDPSSVHMAIELKAVMTEHRKAIKNRKRDLEAHHEQIHNYDSRAIAGGVMLFNIAERFDSPTRRDDDITTPKNPVAKVEHCMSELRNVSMRGGPSGFGLDAKAGIVVNMDNINLAATAYHEQPPAPQVGNPMHYDAFIQRLCSEYVARFL